MHVVFGLEKLCQTTKGSDTEEAMQQKKKTLNHSKRNRKEKATNVRIQNNLSLCPAAVYTCCCLKV